MALVRVNIAECSPNCMRAILLKAIDTAEKVDPQPRQKVEIFMAIGSSVLCGTIPTSLGYKTGQYVRLCRWEEKGTLAYGLNLSNLAMGRFDSRYHFKKVEWHKET